MGKLGPPTWFPVPRPLKEILENIFNVDSMGLAERASAVYESRMLTCSIWGIHFSWERIYGFQKICDGVCDPKNLRKRLKELPRALHTYIV